MGERALADRAAAAREIRRRWPRRHAHDVRPGLRSTARVGRRATLRSFVRDLRLLRGGGRG